MSTPTIVEVEGRKLKLTNLEKILYPATGFTKGQVVDFYVRIAPVLVPHLAGHPLTMKRYPEGIDHEYFFEKNAPMHRPDWVKPRPYGATATAAPSTLFSPTICPRWSGSRTSPRSNCIHRSPSRPTSRRQP
jgi:hypothetical protein